MVAPFSCSYTKNRCFIFNGKEVKMYLTNDTAAQTIYVPRNIGASREGITLEVASTIELESLLPLSVVSVEAHPLYYRLGLRLSEIVTPGEYEYSLKAGEELLSKGLLIIGKAASAGVIEYNKNIIYEQYNA